MHRPISTPGIDDKGQRRSRRREIVAQARGKLFSAIEQQVVEDIGLVVQTAATSDHGLSRARYIPGKANLRSDAFVVVARSPAQFSIEGADKGSARQIRVGQAVVVVITQAAVKGEIPGNFPGIVGVDSDAVIGEAATGQSEYRFFTSVAQAVAHDDIRHGVVQGIGGAIGTERVGRDAIAEAALDFRAQTEERSEPRFVNAVVLNSKLDGVTSLRPSLRRIWFAGSAGRCSAERWGSVQR